jgi:hypothetical protein
MKEFIESSREQTSSEHSTDRYSIKSFIEACSRSFYSIIIIVISMESETHE